MFFTPKRELNNWMMELNPIICKKEAVFATYLVDRSYIIMLPATATFMQCSPGN